MRLFAVGVRRLAPLSTSGVDVWARGRQRLYHIGTGSKFGSDRFCRRGAIGRNCTDSVRGFRCGPSEESDLFPRAALIRFETLWDNGKYADDRRSRKVNRYIKLCPIRGSGKADAEADEMLDAEFDDDCDDEFDDDVDAEFDDDLGDEFDDSSSDSDTSEEGVEKWDNSFELLFLGTGSGGGMLSRHRMSSCLMLKLHRSIYLFDVAEGACRQWGFARGDRKNGVGIRRVEKIFITHMHGDHVLGLPSFVLLVDLANRNSDGHWRRRNSDDHWRQRRSDPRSLRQLDVYGPPGLYNFLAMNLNLICASLTHTLVVVHELWGGREQGGPRPKQQQQQPTRAASADGFTVDSSSSVASPNLQRGDLTASQQCSGRNVFTGHFPEAKLPNLERRVIHRNKQTDTWDINLNIPSQKNQHRKGVIIQAAEIHHARGVQTFGYVVEEEPRKRTLDPVKAQALGVAPGPKYLELTLGKSVRSDHDRSRRIFSDDVCLPSPASRKVAVLGDNYRVSAAMQSLCHNADILVHEATLLGGSPTRGHSTPEAAGRLAARVGARLLLLNHLSPRLVSVKQIEKAVRRARAEAAEVLASSSDADTPTTTAELPQVEAAFDFMQVSVPVGGFPSWEDDEARIEERRGVKRA